MSERTLGGNGRFGFNGQEKDNEIAGKDNTINFMFRSYDSRIGRFKSMDPLFKQYPWNSSYAFAENKVINGNDIEGKEFQLKIYDPQVGSVSKVVFLYFDTINI